LRPLTHQTTMKTREDNAIKVLLVDDEDMILELYSMILGHYSYSEGFRPYASEMTNNGLSDNNDGDNETASSQCAYELIFCRQGDEAVEAVRSSTTEFAIAFIDVRMPPGRDGIWAAEKIRAISPNTQIVIVTGYSDIDPSDIEKRVPPPDSLLYLQKPFHPFEIRQFASALAARWKVEREMQNLNRNLDAMVQQRTAELQKAYKQLEHQAMHDSLTGLLNRRAIFSILKQELSRTQRMAEPLSILLADIDHFKSINDTYGHQAGDAVLVELARRINECIRPYDKIGRIGGEEFMIVLGSCNSAQGLEIAERIRNAIGNRCFEHSGNKLHVTVSIGLAATLNQTIMPKGMVEMP
jgi:diguanylate cyclase (GGDEF)-like protein